MPNINNKPETKTIAKPENDNANDKFKALEDKNIELSKQLAEVMSMLTTLTTTISTKPKEEVVEDIEVKTYNKYCILAEENDIPMPNPLQQIKVMSLCYGSLNLNSSDGKSLLKFNKFGEIKQAKYDTLVEIVNANKEFADTGKFIILDKSAVYHIGLNEEYKKLATKDIFENICSYSDSDIRAILTTLCAEQVEILIRLLCDRLYNGENFDLNRIRFIEKISNTEIIKKVDEMRVFAS